MMSTNDDITVEIAICKVAFQNSPKANSAIEVEVICDDIKKKFAISPINRIINANAYEINESITFIPKNSIDNKKITIEFTLHNKKTKSQKTLSLSQCINQTLLLKNFMDFTFEFPEEQNSFNVVLGFKLYNLTQTVNSNVLHRFSNMTHLDCEESNQGTSTAFCDCFFSASLPNNKTATIIPGSANLPSSCGHKTCSLLPAYLPEIIIRYPYNDKNTSNFSLNSLVASLCFPYGIKICFDQNNKDNRASHDFMFTTTNEHGKRNFIYVYTMYHKIDFVEYKRQYAADPIKDHLLTHRIISLIEENDKKSKDILDKEIDDNFALINKLIDSNYVYIPICYCLVSKYPFMTQMKQCIKSLVKMDQGEIEKFLKHLIYEIPIPMQQSQLYFYIPYNSQCIKINGKNNQKLKLPLGAMKKLFDYFSIENIIKIFNMLIFRKKILFVSSGYDYNILTEISLCFLNAIYPLKWKYTYIPVLTVTMLKFLQSFVPFIMGIEENMLQIAKEYFDDDSDVNIIFLKKEKKSFIKTANCYFGLNSTNNTLNIEMPKEIKEELYCDLAEIRKKIKKEDEKEDNEFKTDKKIKKLFMKTLCGIFGDYKKYVSVIDHISYFNTELYLKEKNISFSSPQSVFYTELVSTEMFNLFLQKCNKYSYFNKHCLIYSKQTNKSTKSSNDIRPMIIKSKTSGEITKTNSGIAISSSESSQNSTLNASNSSNKKSNNFIIPPYFIKPFISDWSKVDEVVKGYNDTHSPKENHQRIISHIPTIQNEFTSNFLRYKLPFSLCDGNSNCEFDTSNKDKVNSTNNNKDVNEISEEKKNLIDNIMRMILSGEKIVTERDSIKINDALISTIDFTDKLILSYFTDIIYQSKFANHSLHIINSKMFDLLSKLVFLSLLHIDKAYSSAKYITKSLFHYYKLNSHKKKIYLFESFSTKKPFEIWLDQSFWYDWFISEKYASNNEDNCFTVLCELSSVMNDLNIDLNFQILCLDEKIAKKHIVDQSLLHMLEVTIVKQYNYKIENQAMMKY